MRPHFLLACFALTGCVSETASMDAAVLDTGTTPDTSSSDTGGGMDSSGMDSGIQDAGADVVLAKFSCGTPVVCNFGTQACCYSPQNTMGSCANPLPDGGAAQCGSNLYRFTCSATAQCAMGDVCCAKQSTLMGPDSGPNAWNASCAATCSGATFNKKVFCNNTSECVSGTCQNVGAGFPVGYKECK